MRGTSVPPCLQPRRPIQGFESPSFFGEVRRRPAARDVNVCFANLLPDDNTVNRRISAVLALGMRRTLLVASIPSSNVQLPCLCYGVAVLMSYILCACRRDSGWRRPSSVLWPRFGLQTGLRGYIVWAGKWEPSMGSQVQYGRELC